SHIQLVADPQMRGRAMALFVVATGGTAPIGGPLVGWIGEAVSPRIAFAIGGLGTAVATLVMVLYLRHSDRDSTGRRSTLKPPTVLRRAPMLPRVRGVAMAARGRPESAAPDEQA